jgi:hypothetical protein
MVAFYLSIIHLPWSLKLAYGLISDNIALFGYKRRSYIQIMGLLQFCSLLPLYFVNETSPRIVTVLLTLTSFSEAFVNVVTDAILCV